MNIIPAALGITQDVLTFWDDCIEIGIALPRTVQLVSEVNFGAGELNETPCLILYLFFGEDTVELYLPEQLPTSPTEHTSVWYTLFSREPDVLKIRYGTHPSEEDKEVTLLLPKAEGERMIERLRLFAKRYLEQPDESDVASSLRLSLHDLLEEFTDASGES